jgi:hypothetical protein
MAKSKSCLTCGVDISDRGPRAKTCGAACRKAAQRDRASGAARRAARKAPDIPPLAVSRAREAAAKAERAEVELAVRRGELLPKALLEQRREALEAEAHRYSVAVREHMLGLVERVRGDVPPEGWPLARLVEWLDQAVRDVLELAATQLAEEDQEDPEDDDAYQADDDEEDEG